jgi:sugar transferase (PEP-CTERM/EpsH1 system associated)
MIQHLSKAHSVVVASLAETEKELHDGLGLKQYCDELIAEVLPRSVRWTQAWQALFTGKPSSVAYFWSSKLKRRVQNALFRDKFDAIFVHCAFVAPYVCDIPAGLRVLDFGDIDSAKWFAYSRWKPFPISLGYELEARKLRKFEKLMATRFHHCTVTAQGELDEFRDFNAPVSCTLIINGFDSAAFKNIVRKESGDSPVIVFVGRMDYFPNIDGILYFANEILPIIRRTVPQAKLRVVGSNPSRKVRELANIPGVSVTGHVPDVRPYLADATVSVAPLRIVRGTQNKILESMAAGIPTVATAEAAKGVQCVPGEHLLVADGPDAFANEIIKIIENRTLGKKLAEAGRRQIAEAHTWDRSMELLDAILKHKLRTIDRSAARQIAE